LRRDFDFDEHCIVNDHVTVVLADDYFLIANGYFLLKSPLKPRRINSTEAIVDIHDGENRKRDDCNLKSGSSDGLSDFFVRKWSVVFRFEFEQSLSVPICVHPWRKRLMLVSEIAHRLTPKAFAS